MDVHSRINNILKELYKLQEEHGITTEQKINRFTPTQTSIVETLIKLTYTLYHDV